MREFRTSIYSRPVARQLPTYHTVSWLDIVRGEKRLAQKQAALDRMTLDALTYGTGFSLSYIALSDVFNNPENK